MKCVNCGAENQNDVICQECGFLLEENIECVDKKDEYNMYKSESKIKKDESIKTDNDSSVVDSYEKELEKKKEIEDICGIIAGIIWLGLCGTIVKNNWGYRDFEEVLILCIIITAIVVAVCNAIDACLGVYKAGENLERYIKLKKEVGRVEAIKVMEQTTNGQNGFVMLNAGIKGGFSFAKAGIKGILGFVITILLLIIAVSLC